MKRSSVLDRNRKDKIPTQLQVLANTSQRWHSPTMQSSTVASIHDVSLTPHMDLENIGISSVEVLRRLVRERSHKAVCIDSENVVAGH